MEATFRRGYPEFTPYQSATARAAGEVIVAGNNTRIAHRAIAANELSNVAVHGGIYRVGKDASDIADGATLYWDDANGVVTTTASTNKKFGVAMAAAGTAAAEVEALHLAAA